jgi:raffinose/stachyose/melibiose transport system permease protein
LKSIKGDEMAIETVRRKRVRSSDDWQVYLFVLPAFLLFAAFVLFPLAASLYYGFTKWDGMAAPQWIGFDNYLRAFKDSIHLRSYLNATLYVLGTLIVEVGLGLIMAVLLNHDRPGFSFFRVMCFSPVVLSFVAAAILWTFVYDLRFGLLNAFLKSIGLSTLVQPWLANPNTALAAVTIVSGWKYAGFYMVIYLAALKRIPASLYEAAMLDGAGVVQRFFNITLPLLRETTLIALLLAITGGFAGFDLFFAMTNGQPFNATEIPTTWIIKQAFDAGQMGYGVALTVILMLVIGVISIVYLRLTRRGGTVEY